MSGIQQYREQNPHNLTEAQLSQIESELESPSDGTISDERLDYELWRRGLKSRQEGFADYVDGAIAGRGVKHILEVGGGRLGRLSVLLAERGYRMTCMDPRLEIESRPSVKAVKEAFDYRTVSLDGYDLVIGEEPCEAAEHIVRAGLEQKIPFIVALCGTPHKLISGEQPKDIWEWYDYLNHIDCGRTEMKIMKLYGSVGIMIIRSLPATQAVT